MGQANGVVLGQIFHHSSFVHRGQGPDLAQIMPLVEPGEIGSVADGEPDNVPRLACLVLRDLVGGPCLESSLARRIEKWEGKSFDIGVATSNLVRHASRF